MGSDTKVIIKFGQTAGIELSELYVGLIILMPILNQYQVFGINFFDLFNVVALLIIALKREHINIKNQFLYYLIYSFIFMISLSFFLRNLSLAVMIKKVVVYAALVINMYFVGIEKFDIKNAFKIYTAIVKFLSAVLLIQIFLFYVIHIKTALYLPFATLNYGDGGMAATQFISNVLNHPNYRPSALLLEPAGYAEYILPWVYLSLFNVEHSESTKHIAKVGIISLILCLSTSSIALLGVAIAWLIYLEKLLFSRKSYKLMVLIPVLVCVGIGLLNVQSVQFQIQSKLFSMKDIHRGTSLSYRLFRGWYIFQQFPVINKFFGCGYGLIAQYLTQYHITTILDTERSIISTYMNGIHLMLCTVGYIGTILYFCGLLTYVKKNRKIIPLFICWLILQISAQVFDTPTLFIVLFFIVALSRMDGIIYNSNVNQLDGSDCIIYE